MAYDGRWFMGVHLIEGWDGLGWISSPVHCVNRVLPCLLVVPIFLRYLLHPNAKSSSCDTMMIIVPQKVLCHDICSCSNAHNWTSRDEMPSVATFPIVSSLGG